MELNLAKNTDQESSVSSVLVSDAVFNCAFKEALVHQVITACQAAMRSGSKAQLSRSEVSGGGAKPWRQKGSGRARAGTSRGPLWRKGGVTFAAEPGSYSQKINKKMYRGALCSILSRLVKEERLLVVESFLLESRRTKELLSKLRNMNLDEVLIVTNDIDKNLYLASRNLCNVEVADAASVNPTALVGFNKTVITVPALRQLEGILI